MVVERVTILPVAAVSASYAGARGCVDADDDAFQFEDTEEVRYCLDFYHRARPKIDCPVRDVTSLSDLDGSLLFLILYFNIVI